MRDTLLVIMRDMAFFDKSELVDDRMVEEIYILYPP